MRPLRRLRDPLPGLVPGRGQLAPKEESDQVNLSPTLTPESRQELIARLRKIEGQTRGIQRMIEEERECREILNQLASVRAATQHVSRELIRGYLQGCLSSPTCSAGDETLNDLVELLMRA